MATYSTLEYSSITDVIIPFETFNGIDKYSTGTDILSGYTLDITSFTFTAVVSALENTNIGASLDKLIWDFGDGTHATGFTVNKKYDYPGRYVVTTIITDQNGVTHRNRASQTIDVYNYVPDALQWWTPTISNEFGGEPEKAFCGVPSDDLTIYRYNSWQSWPVVSGDGGYFINLYSQGSLSRPLVTEQYWSSPDVHFVPTWRFVKDKDSTVPISRVQTDHNTDVYVKLDNGKIKHTTSEDPLSVFAGTSGYTTVNYIDDNSNRLISSDRKNKGQKGTSQATFKNENISEAEFKLSTNTGSENKDIILFASFDSSKFPITRDDAELARFDVLKNDYFQIYETQKVGLPIIIKLAPLDHLSITSSGIKSMPINRNKYINSPISFSVRYGTASGDIICTDDFVPLSSRWEATSTAFSGGDVTTDVVTSQGFMTLYLSGEDSQFMRVVDRLTTHEDFKHWDLGEVIPVVGENGEILTANTTIVIKLGDRVPDDSTDYDVRDIYDKKVKFNGRTVTLLATNLDESVRHGLKDTTSYDLQMIARTWLHESGREYFGCLSDVSRFNINDSKDHIDMTISKSQMSTQTYGTYNGVLNLDADWSSIEDQNRYRLFAETKVDPPLYFNYDVLYYYLTNPSNDVFHQIKPVYYREYSYGNDGYTQTYTPPVTTTTPGNSGLYGFAVYPDGHLIMVDGDTDKIVRYYRSNALRDETQIHTLLPDVSAQHYPGDPTKYGYSPSSVSLDKDLNYWITLYDTVSTIKIDADTGKVVASAVPPVVNYLANVRTTNPTEYWSASASYDPVEVEGLPGEYGENLICPTMVETCKNNDIVVTYTNPLCSFVCRYDSYGNHLYTFDLSGAHDQYITGDICVDVSDHVWLMTEETGLLSSGEVNMDPPRGRVYSLDEELKLRLMIDSVKGTEFQDMMAPVPATNQQIEYNVGVISEWNYETNDFVSQGILIEEYGGEFVNPPIKLYEGNTYTFNNLYYNNGQNPLVLRNILATEKNLAVSATWDQLTPTGELYMDNVTAREDGTLSIYVSSTTPSAMLLVNDNYFGENRLVVKTFKKPEIRTRKAETFDIINNPTHIIPDASNHIWFSWGSRYCSRYNTGYNKIDMTVAVGSAFPDPRFDPLSAHTHDRRDNADRQSAIEGISMDTGNNLLVINNAEKRLYAMNSDSPPVSAYINIATYQQPASEFTWIESISSKHRASQDDFLLPSSYLTDEQIEVFLRNVDRGGNMTQEKREKALENYLNLSTGASGSMTFPTHHSRGEDVAFTEEIRAGGDWTGFRWINKYDNRVVRSDASSGLISLTGCSNEFQLLPEVGAVDLSKINEDIDFAGVLREYIQQPSLKERNIFYNTFLDTVFGTTGSSPLAIGKRIYERIANFTMNHSDIDTCTVSSLRSMAQMLDYKLIDLGAALPAEMDRLMDLLSIKFTKLRGTRTDYQDDFEKYGNLDQKTVGTNLGAELVFIYDYDEEMSYNTHDFVRGADGEYYQSTQVVPAGVHPRGRVTSEYWRHWPDGHVKSQHYDDVERLMNRAFQTQPQLRKYISEYKSEHGEHATELEKTRLTQEKYDEQVTIIKLLDKLLITVDDKFVLKPEHADNYNVVTGMLTNWDEQRDYEITLVGNKYKISNAFTGDDVEERNKDRRFSEYLSTSIVDHGLVTLNDDIITLIGESDDINPTIVLFKGRTYRFNLDCFGEPLTFTETPGLSGVPIDSVYVGSPGTEFGTVVLRTDFDPIHGPVPDRFYYQSETTATNSGTVLIRDIHSVANYSNELGGVSAYYIDLSFNTVDHLQSIGWGVDAPRGENVWKYYSLYEYISDGNVDQHYTDNVLNWYDETNDETTTSIAFEQASEPGFYSEWEKDGGYMDITIEKTLRKGLGLFKGVDSLNTNYYNK